MRSLYIAPLLVLILLNAPAVHADDMLEVHATRPIPNRFIKQGEIRLMQRGETMIVQTILHTKYLDRIVEEIGKKEAEYWGSTHIASRTYLTHLKDAVAAAHKLADENGEEKRRLAINFIEDSQGTRTEFSMPAIDSTRGAYAPTTGEAWRALACPKDYIRGNQNGIIDDAFGRKARKLQATVDANRERIAREP